MGNESIKSIIFFTLFFTISSGKIEAQYIKAGQVLSNAYYYDIIPDTTIQGIHNFNAGFFDIDLDGNGINDFNISSCDCSGLGGGNPNTRITPLNNNEIAFGYIDSCFTFGSTPAFYDAHKMAYAFSAGDTINNYPTWLNNYAELSYYDWIMGNHSCAGQTFTNQLLYLGLRITSLSDTLYGWIGINVNSNTIATIYDFACNKSALAITENQHIDFTFYPNPAKDKIMVEHLVQNGFYLLSVYNSFGVEIIRQKITQNNTEINLNGFERGMFLLMVIDEKGNSTRKLIIE